MKTRYLILLCLSFIFLLQSNAQTTFWTESFNNGCTSLCLANAYSGPNGAWTETLTGTNGALANAWYVSCAENGNTPGNCGTGCMGNATLHVANVVGSPGGLCPTGDCGAAYDASLASVITNKRIESPLIDCSGHFNIQMQFNFIAAGQAGSDFFTMLYSPDGGSNWSSLGIGPTSLCCCNILDCFLSGCCEPSTTTCGSLRQGSWSQASVTLPASANQNPNVKIAFLWQNNGDNIGSDPSVAIDEIQLSGDLFLPVELIDFSVNVLETATQLEWTTASETDYKHFSVERSEDALAWKVISIVEPLGHNNENNSYEYFDRIPLQGVSYYRLKLVAQNNQIDYSRIISATRKEESGTISIFPNPANDFVNILLPKRSTAATVRIFSLNGKEIISESFVETQQIFFNTSALQPGIYLIEVETGQSKSTLKLIIQD